MPRHLSLEAQYRVWPPSDLSVVTQIDARLLSAIARLVWEKQEKVRE